MTSEELRMAVQTECGKDAVAADASDLDLAALLLSALHAERKNWRRAEETAMALRAHNQQLEARAERQPAATISTAGDRELVIRLLKVVEQLAETR